MFVNTVFNMYVAYHNDAGARHDSWRLVSVSVRFGFGLVRLGSVWFGSVWVWFRSASNLLIGRIFVNKSSKTNIFEGFRPNGLQIQNQRIFLHRIALVKFVFGAFLVIVIICNGFDDIR